ncbi:MAG: aryl-sulfate sulfotransferase, partial [Promethearchaeota archaeon]
MKKRNKIILGIVFSVIIIGIITSTSFFFILRAQTTFLIEAYDPARADNGTTLFADMHDTANPRIVEVDMNGNALWQYVLPDDLKGFTNPGMDVESLPNGNVLFICPLKGVYEVNRAGTIVWSYLNSKVSHDVDRLANGNTLICWGGSDTKTDHQAIEVNPSGTIVWSWQAAPHYDVPPYDTISTQGWTHANAVHRLANGNTLINLRNFNLTVEVNP